MMGVDEFLVMLFGHQVLRVLFHARRIFINRGVRIGVELQCARIHDPGPREDVGILYGNFILQAIALASESLHHVQCVAVELAIVG